MNDLAVWNDFVRRPDWFDLAACSTMPTAMFFTNNNDRGETDAERAAKQVCAGCPVRTHCLAFGLRERFGIWGGRTPTERRRIRRVSTPTSVA